MRWSLNVATGLALLAGVGAAQASVAITVSKNTQQMTVAVDGVQRYNWPVSTGNPSHETPNGSFRTFRMEKDHYSKEFDDAPMPHSIFFTKNGHAIHGTDSVARLGSPASHGCVRLSRANASKLYALVQSEGVLNTTVTLSGSSRIALANARTRQANAKASRDPAQYDAAGNPLELEPQLAEPGQIAPRLSVDGGYIYPSDHTSPEASYATRRGYRRYYNAQANSQSYGSQYYQPQYAPQAYVPQPYYQPRGYYGYQD